MGGAYDPDFSVDLSRSRANFRGSKILYIFLRNAIPLRLMLIPVFHNGLTGRVMQTTKEIKEDGISMPSSQEI